MMRLMMIAIFLAVSACKSELPMFAAHDYLSEDQSSGFFVRKDSVSIGTVVYEGSAPVEFGAESKVRFSVSKVRNGLCIHGQDLAIAIPRDDNGSMVCNGVNFEVKRCKNMECIGLVVRRLDVDKGRHGPLHYSYRRDCGITAMSYDPRGILHNPLVSRVSCK
jgi:hypothetical protein